MLEEYLLARMFEGYRVEDLVTKFVLRESQAGRCSGNGSSGTGMLVCSQIDDVVL